MTGRCSPYRDAEKRKILSITLSLIEKSVMKKKHLFRKEPYEPEASVPHSRQQRAAAAGVDTSRVRANWCKAYASWGSESVETWGSGSG